METKVIEQTTNWIKSVVIDCNFCPFAAKAMLKNSIRYIVLSDTTVESVLEAFADELQLLDVDNEVETTLIILPNDFSDFEGYLDLVALAEALNETLGYEGIYQIASFHPDYCFEGAENDDAANYTNRSIYPMLHILREESITKVLESFPDPEGIPERNIAFAQHKGLKYMELLRASCL
ncbi:MAG: DUF1415 domain-containing protein [Bacteroidia bacterium]